MALKSADDVWASSSSSSDSLLLMLVVMIWRKEWYFKHRRLIQHRQVSNYHRWENPVETQPSWMNSGSQFSWEAWAPSSNLMIQTRSTHAKKQAIQWVSFRYGQVHLLYIARIFVVDSWGPGSDVPHMHWHQWINITFSCVSNSYQYRDDACSIWLLGWFDASWKNDLSGIRKAFRWMKLSSLRSRSLAWLSEPSFLLATINHSSSTSTLNLSYISTRQTCIHSISTFEVSMYLYISTSLLPLFPKPIIIRFFAW